MKNSKWFILSLLLLTLVLRLPQFGFMPVGLNRDEAALGYNAFSILKTGRDEFGQFLPTSITSFGDQKLPGYVYTLIPFIATLGAQASVIRLPSLLSGLAVILLSGRLIWLIFDQVDRKKNWKISVLSMFFITVSPWGNHFSRVAYEAHLALAFFLGGMVAWLESQRAPKQQKFLVPLAALGFSLALATYHSYQILVPLTVLGLIWLQRKKIREINRTGLIAGIGIALITILMLWQGGVWRANQTKFSGISPFSSQNIADRYFAYRQAFPGNIIMERLIANRFTEQMSIFFAHAVETLSTDFLFTSTTTHRVHNQSGIGNFHLFLAPLLFIGLAEIWQKRKEKPLQLLWLWLLAGIVAPSLTIAPQHTIRLSPIFPLIEMFGAIGAITLWSGIKSVLSRKIFLIAAIIIAVFTVVRHQLQYLVIAPQKDAQHSHEKWHLLAQSLGKYQNSADELVTQSPSSSPYIWYALLNQYDPALFQQTVQRYPADKEGFQHVERVGNVTFQTIQWEEIFARAKDHSIILFLQPKEVSLEPLDSNLSLLETVNNRAGEPAWYIMEVKR